MKRRKMNLDCSLSDSFLDCLVFSQKYKLVKSYTRQSKKQSESEQSKSAVADHAVQNNHVINWDDAKAL